MLLYNRIELSRLHGLDGRLVDSGRFMGTIHLERIGSAIQMLCRLQTTTEVTN